MPGSVLYDDVLVADDAVTKSRFNAATVGGRDQFEGVMDGEMAFAGMDTRSTVPAHHYIGHN